MHSDEIDYEILGTELQVVEIELDPGETVIAEAGAMTWMDSSISYEAKMGDGSRVKSGFWSSVTDIGSRVLSGESLFVTHFKNTGNKKAKVAFAAPYPGAIVPISLPDVGGAFYAQKDAFLCGALGTRVGMHLNKKFGTGFFGGEGFVMQKISGDGMAFIQAGGTIVQKDLVNDSLIVDTGCVVGFTDGINFNIQSAGSLKSMLFGGEGLFLANLSGTGSVLVQSLPFSRMADRIIAHAPSSGGSSKGESSLLGSFLER